MKRRSRGEQMLAAAGVASPSVLKPVQQQQQAPGSPVDLDEARSPPVKRQRSAVKAAPLASSPLRRDTLQVQENAPKLNPELELLAAMFDALQTGRMMFKRRAEKVTYNSVRHVVENMTKREFKVEHLAQMRALRPESFDWQYIRTPSAGNPLILETQLLLTFERQAAVVADGGSVGRYSAAAENGEFRAALERYVRDNPTDAATGKPPAIPQAALPPRPATTGNTPTRSASLPHGAGLLAAVGSPAASGGGVSAAGAAGLRSVASCPAGGLPDLQASPSGGGSQGSIGASPALTRTRSRLGLPAGALPSSLTPIPESATGTPTRHNASATPAPRPTGQAQHRTKQGLGQALAQAAEGGANGTGAADAAVEDAAVEGGEEVVLEDGEGEDAAAALEEPALELTQQGNQGGGGSAFAAASPSRTMGFGTGATATPEGKGVRLGGPQVTTPTSHQQQAGGGPDPSSVSRLHRLLSPAALQRIMQNEETQAAQTPEAKRRGEMRRAVQLLPQAHELVRVVFGLSGPTIKPMKQVAQQMVERSMSRSGLREGEASNALVALARAAPDFLRIEEPKTLADGSGRPRSIAISRAGSMNAVAAKLKALAADPDAAVEALFGAGGGAAAAAAVGRSGGMGVAAASPGPSARRPAAESPTVAAVGVQEEEAAAETEPVAGSPTGRLRPRALLLDDAADSGSGAAGDDSGSGAGSTLAVTAAAGEMPPPPPSARKRPPGLPMCPPSPAMHRGLHGAPPPSPLVHRGGGATPTRTRPDVPPPTLLSPRAMQRAGGSATPSRSSALRGGGLVSGAQPPQGTPTKAQAQPLAAVALPPVAAGGAELLAKLCNRPAASPAPKVSPAAAAASASVAGAQGQGAVAALEISAGGRTPSRVAAAGGGRTPGRTAVQEAMLQSSARRSSARRSRLAILGAGDDEEAREEEGANVEDRQDGVGAKPRRLVLGEE